MDRWDSRYGSVVFADGGDVSLSGFAVCWNNTCQLWLSGTAQVCSGLCIPRELKKTHVSEPSTTMGQTSPKPSPFE